MGSVTTGEKLSPRSVVDFLRRDGVAIPRSDEIVAYLNAHPDLADLLPRVVAETRHEFGPKSQLTLDIRCDLEINDEHLQLVIRLSSYDDTVMARLDAVTKPFDAELSQSSGYLLLTSDFQPLRGSDAV